MNSILRSFLIVVFAAALTQCETMEGNAAGTTKTITVEGTLFYPDEANTTFIVPEGAQVIGAGGKNCHYIVHKGASLTAHAGESNTFRIKSGGHFRGFAHPATKCTVVYESGAIIEREQMGPGTRFEGT
ncbi:MAG: hypothetical protein P1U85_21620 [Verrucomicrobiales bacterium]|jgi:hypothetical protein|nr:hypothetical protein [Verrucomicrobiales bacterium]